MRALLIRRFGGPDVAELADVPEPAPGPTEMLVDVRAASVNPVDFKIREGALRRLLALPFPIVLGNDLAGVVRSAGASVRRFRAGDRIFARLRKDRIGAFAERAVVDEAHAALVPERLTFEEAASIPLAGLTAWQALVDVGDVKAGARVLIHAGAGGVGTLAIQIAKHLGAEVATTASAKNADLCRSLGADRVIDYRAEDFERALRDVDFVLDTQGGETQAKSFRVLRRGGLLVSVVGPPDAKFARGYGLGPLVVAALAVAGVPRALRLRRLGVRYEFLFMRPSGEELAKIGDLVDAGKVKPVIDAVFPLAQAREALARVEAGHARGKVVVTMA
jgi:NADPH:quinone reductase-like Zn-dependent oxidoreductase